MFLRQLPPSRLRVERDGLDRCRGGRSRRRRRLAQLLLPGAGPLLATGCRCVHGLRSAGGNGGGRRGGGRRRREEDAAEEEPRELLAGGHPRQARGGALHEDGHDLDEDRDRQPQPRPPRHHRHRGQQERAVVGRQQRRRGRDAVGQGPDLPQQHRHAQHQQEQGAQRQQTAYEGSGAGAGGGGLAHGGQPSASWSRIDSPWPVMDISPMPSRDTKMGWWVSWTVTLRFSPSPETWTSPSMPSAAR